MSIDVLLLDFGGVCLVHPHELHNKTEQLLGLETGTLSWLGAVDPSTDEMWRQVMAGELSEGDYFDRRSAELGELAGRQLSRADYFELLYVPPTPAIIRPEATATVLAAKAAGYGVSVLTNDLAAFQGPDWQHGVDFFELVDHVVDCSLTGVYKPAPEAFAHTASVIGVPLERMFFVDDQPKNVDGASAVGLESLWFDVADAGGGWAATAARLELTVS